MLSPTDPLRSGQPSGKRDWQRINALDTNAGREKDQRLSDRDTSARFYGLQFDDPTFHPLKIYRFPVCLRAAPNASTDYAKIRVHAGRYNGTKILNTDGHDLNPADSGYPDFPDLDYLPQESDGGDIQIPPNTSQYWVWVDISNTAVPMVKSGYLGQAVSGNIGSPPNNGWLQFPNADPNVVPIGWVDDATDAPNNNLYIRQFQKSDIWATPGGTPNTPNGTANSGLIICTLTSVGGDYWVCNTPNVGGSGNVSIHVNKPNPIRASITGETILGQAFTYGYGLSTGNSYPASCTRSSTRASDGYVEYQALNPMPQVGWQLLAGGGNSLNPSSGTWLDTGTWGCEWFAPNDQNPADW